MQIADDAPSIADDVDLAASEVFPIDLHAPVRQVHVGGPNVALADGARGEEPPAERLVYSSTLGTFSFAPGQNVRVADDVMTTAGPGCPITRLEFMVNTRVLPELPGGPVTVSWALYNICPGAVPPDVLENYLVQDDVTEGDVQLTEDGLHVVAVTLSQPVATNGSFWLSLIFSRANAGPVGGAPATEGHSDDRFHQSGSVACSVNFGDFPPEPHGSFHVQFWSGDCAASKPGYRSTWETGPQFNPGTNSWVVDDLELLGGPCTLVGYQVAIRGAGTYNFEFRESCAGPAIAGTERTQIASTANQNTRILRFTVDPPVALPPSTWLAARVNNSSAMLIASGLEPVIGSSEDFFGRQAPGAVSCTLSQSLAGRHDSLHLIVYCEGEAPIGACCDPYLLECQGGESDGDRCENAEDCVEPGACGPLCRQLPEYACWFPPRGDDDTIGWVPQWLEQQACSPHPFVPECGKWACCKPDDTCENLTEVECEAVEPLDRPREWQIGLYCDEGTQGCPFNACLIADGHCGQVRTNPGCQDFNCCETTCEQDPWCCSVEWDPYCAGRNLDCHSFGWNSSCGSANDLAPGQSMEGTTDHNVSSEPASCFPTSSNEPIGSLWFKFVAPDYPVRVHTCNTNPPYNDMMMAAYAVGDPSTPQTACNTKTEVACNFDSPACSGGVGSELCLSDLVPGQSYLVQVAVPDGTTPALVRVEMEAGCPNDGSTASEIQDAPVELARVTASTESRGEQPPDAAWRTHLEVPDDSPMTSASARSGLPPATGSWSRNGVTSVQVNVDAIGNNIPGDAANEPSIAVDPTAPNRKVIGWRQFDNVQSNFRQAGWAYSHNGGLTWVFPGVLEAGIFRSDPVLAADSSGSFHYYSLLGSFECDLFTSFDGGVTWPQKRRVFGGDKPWIVSDPASSGQYSLLYATWSSSANFTRSFNAGDLFSYPDAARLPTWGTMAVGPDRELYVAGGAFAIKKATNAHVSDQVVAFQTLDTEGYGLSNQFADPNPGGLIGQTWIVVDHSPGPSRGNVYALATALLSGTSNVVFTRSTDGGATWSTPVPVHPNTDGWQWFGTMSIAPNGRLDVFWNDTQPTGQVNLCELRYSYSTDGGVNWAKPLAVSPVFDSWVGWPNQDKIGDYYHSVSDDLGVSLAYAATFNGEQDIYFLRIGGQEDCNKNGFADDSDVAEGRSPDCNGNGFPDECETDFDADGLIDECDPDMDNDGILNDADRCDHTGPGQFNAEGHHLADTNRNCWLDLADFWRLRNCMQGGRPGMPAPQAACLAAFDRNGDDQTDLADFAVFQNEYGETQP